MRRGEITNRIDVALYHPSYSILLGKLEDSKFKVAKLEDLLEEETGIRYGTGTPPPIIEPNANSLPFIRATDIKDSQILLGGLLHINAKQDKSMDKCKVKAGELILVRSGVNTGDCAVVPQSLDGGYAAYDLILRFNKKALPYYVSYFLDTKIGRAQMNVRKGRAAQPHINAEEVSSIKIPLPPLETQRALIAEMETARAMRQSKLAQAESLLKGIDQFVLDELGLKLPKKIERKSYATRLKHIKTAQTLNSDYFHPERMNALKTIQRNSPRLRVERLADIADFIRDITTVQEDDNYIGLASVQSNTGELVEVEETAEGQCFRYQKNDVLFGRLRPYLNKIRCAEEDGVCSTEFHVIRLRKRSNPKEEISPEYLAVILRSSIILAQTKHMMTGNTHPRLTNDDVVNLIVPIPRDIKAQSKIVTELQKRRSQARSLREEAERQWREAKEKFEKALLG